ncbi:hypothetical protein [Aquirhabdus sp.]|uniref:hypothetical protein n=1 Tax=Aquirhabdus sp. TaxID=2824160 RepID=UPI00396CDA72
MKTALFEHRYILFFAVILSFLLSLPMLSSGLMMDDYQQRLTLLTGSHDNLFEFFSRGNPVTEAQIQSGVLPWWTFPDYKVSFFRPLAAWFIQLDYKFWPNNFLLMHLHSMLWYALLVWVVGLTYRSLMPAWAAGLAVILFAIDPPHANAVAWLCNRNILICLICGLLCLWCHRRSNLFWRVPAALLFLVGLSSGESALAISGYLLAYELFLSGRKWFVSIVHLLPYAAIGLAWLGYWHVAGYGTTGPGFYLDPGHHPTFFLQEVLYRLPAYLISQFFPPPAEAFWVFETLPQRMTMMLPALAYAVVILSILTWFFWPLLRSSPVARFYALGMLIAAIPICGSTPVSRALLYVSFGASGLLALYIHHYREGGLDLPVRRTVRIFIGVMLILHLYLSPLFYLAMAKSTDLLDQKMDTQVVGLPNSSGADRRILLISSRSYPFNVTFPLLKDQTLSLGTAPTRPTPTITRVRSLIAGPEHFELARPEADRLVLRGKKPFYGLITPPYRFTVGQTVNLDDIEITVQSVSHVGAPIELAYQFKKDVLKTYEIMNWSDEKERFISAELPPVNGVLQF